MARIAWIGLLLAASAAAAVYQGRLNLWLALPALYLYWFFYGFWVAIGHELQHGTVFARSAEWLNEGFFYFVQTLMWNSPTYARISHKLHHRYTMVRGVDPETDWPEVITTRWLRGFLLNLVFRILVLGAVLELFRSIALQLRRAAGRRDRLMREHCTEAEIRAIRIESAAILLAHAAVAVAAVVLRRWELLAFLTIAWQVGSPMEILWHATKHIGRPYNVNDHRLNTRSVRVGWFIKSFFWGLDDHVDHHLYPAVPSRNLPELHRLLEKELPEPQNLFGCWVEMFEISRQKDRDPRREFVSVQP